MWSWIFAKVDFYWQFIRMFVFIFLSLLVMVYVFRIPLPTCGGNSDPDVDLTARQTLGILAASLIPAPVLLRLRSIVVFVILATLSAIGIQYAIHQYFFTATPQ